VDATKLEKANFRSDQWESAYNILMPSLPQDVGMGQRTFAGYNDRGRGPYPYGAGLLEAVDSWRDNIHQNF
jgi:hypothetical protein